MAEPRFFPTPEDFRAWLEKHHATTSELLVGFYKRSSGHPSLTWSESVDEALSFGWIDGVRRSAGDEAYTIRFTPRKATSIWSAINVARVQALRASGRMQLAGEAAFARRSEAKTAIYSFERKEPAKLTEDESRAFAAKKRAHAFFEAQAPGYKRTALHWIVSAKRAETRAKRLATLMTDSAAGRRLAHLSRPTKEKPGAPE